MLLGLQLYMGPSGKDEPKTEGTGKSLCKPYASHSTEKISGNSKMICYIYLNILQLSNFMRIIVRSADIPNGSPCSETWNVDKADTHCYIYQTFSDGMPFLIFIYILCVCCAERLSSYATTEWERDHNPLLGKCNLELWMTTLLASRHVDGIDETSVS